jgi:Zn-dependent peptidase ImmA (M78 family)/DNA-binding XRE family transcriptional regulator
MTTQALINPTLLRWARERAGFDVEDAAADANIKAEQLAAWEQGEKRPTFRQAQKLAQVLHAPFGYFFLREPPADHLPLPDLRTVGNASVPTPSLDLLETIRTALQRQSWYQEYLNDHGAEKLSFVGRFRVNSSVAEVAADIRTVLGVPTEEANRTWETYFRDLVQAAENVGILVMRSGVVGNNTRRKLDVQEFRGFAISDSIAPVVFVNSADAPAARLFTLIHEIAHLWIGTSGISDVAPGNSRREEVFCNAVAGEFLAPRDLFLAGWNASSSELASRVAELAGRFHVSQLVIMRRAFDLGLVSQATYRDHYLLTLEKFRQANSNGGSFFRTARAKNSLRFASAVVTEALSGRMLLRDAGRLLGVPPNKIQAFGKQIGI